MNKQLIIAAVILLFGSMACKKNETSSPQQNQGIEASASNEVKQKMYDLTPEETTIYIKNLKNQFKSTSQLKSLGINGSIEKDSALWEIEALLNYTFDRSEREDNSYIDSIGYSINLNIANAVDYSELNNAYNYFANQIANHLSINPLNKVKLVDIIAFENANTLIVTANIIYTIDNNSNHRVNTNPCDPITGTSHWASATNTGAMTWPCTSIPGPHAPELCNIRLNNCSQYACGNGTAPYFTNVITLLFGTTSGTSNPWHYHSPLNSSAPCDNEYLSASQMNANVTSAQSFAASNIPASPTGMVITNYRFHNMFGWPYTWSNSIYAGYWLLDVTYGKRNCGSMPD
jgi:hypothetical protein